MVRNGILLAQFDEAIDAIRHDGQVLRNSDGVFRWRVCGIGRCQVPNPLSAEDVRARCPRCGYWHTFGNINNLPGWE